MASGGRRVTRREIDAPFGEGADNDNKMEWSRMSAHFAKKELARMALLDGRYTIFEDGRPEVPYTQYLLGRSKP